jgi:hypothetical protein
LVWLPTGLLTNSEGRYLRRLLRSLDPGHWQRTACDNLMDFSGAPAILESTGQTFDGVAQKRKGLPRHESSAVAKDSRPCNEPTRKSPRSPHLDAHDRAAPQVASPNAKPSKATQSPSPGGSFCARRKSVVVVRAFPGKFVPGFDRHRDERLHRKDGPDGPQRFAG